MKKLLLIARHFQLYHNWNANSKTTYIQNPSRFSPKHAQGYTYKHHFEKIQRGSDSWLIGRAGYVRVLAEAHETKHETIPRILDVNSLMQ